jgi:hypothetical protein
MGFAEVMVSTTKNFFPTTALVTGNMERTDPLNIDKILQLLTKPMSDFDNDESGEGEDIVDAREENTDTEEVSFEDGSEEEVEDRMNSFY